MKVCEYCKGEFSPCSIEQIYCTRSHAKRAAKKRTEERRLIREMTINGTGHGICPHPYKRNYSSPEQAALDEFPAANYELYRCVCGGLHYTSNLTRNPNRKIYNDKREPAGTLL